MTKLHSSSRKQLVLKLLNKRTRLQPATSKGFTLIELLVVIVILGVLGAVGYQSYVNQLLRANQAAAQTAATAAAKACAANLVIEDEEFGIDDFVDDNRVQLLEGGDATCDAIGAEIPFVVRAGSGANVATCTATVLASGGVRPDGCAGAGDGADGGADGGT